MSVRIPARFLDVVRLGMWAGIVVLVALSMALYCQRGFRDLDREQAAQSRVGRVLVVSGGDVSLRDIPKAHEMLQGGFFSDPYYRGEAHWYPFLTPALAALEARITGRDLPDAYFRLEIVATAFYLIAVGCAVAALAGPSGVAAVPVALLAGWLQPGHGLYPGEVARGPFIIFLILAGLIWMGKTERWRSPVAYGLLGMSVGVFCLWHGASFILAAMVTCFLLLPLVRDVLRSGFSRPTLLRLALVPAGALPPMLLLFGPQLLKYGRLVFPRQAAEWMAAIYEHHVAADALRLALVPRDFGLVLVVAFALRALFPTRLGSPRWRLAQPLLLAFVVALLGGHAGFLIADPAHPDLARMARAMMPVPPHTLWGLAQTLLPVCKALGLLALAQAAWLGTVRLIRKESRMGALVHGVAKWGPGLLAFLLMVVLPFRLPSLPARYSGVQDRAFYDFTKKVAGLLHDSPVFFRYPGMFVQGGAFKIPALSVDEYANPYVHRTRTAALGRLNDAIASGDLGSADRYFQENGFRFLMQDPRASNDIVILRCGGRAIAEHRGYILRQFEGCRP